MRFRAVDAQAVGADNPDTGAMGKLSQLSFQLFSLFCAGFTEP